MDDAIHLRNGEFAMFCREFKIPISRERALQMFNKVSEFHKPINFDKFIELLDKLAIELNEYRQ